MQSLSGKYNNYGGTSGKDNFVCNLCQVSVIIMGVYL